MQRFWGWYQESRKLPLKKGVFFQRCISLNILVPCTLSGKEDVNKYTGKETTLPAQVSSAQ